MGKIQKFEKKINDLKKDCKQKEGEILYLKQRISKQSEDINAFHKEIVALKTQTTKTECAYLKEKKKNTALGKKIYDLDSRLNEIQESPKKALGVLFKAIIKLK